MPHVSRVKKERGVSFVKPGKWLGGPSAAWGSGNHFGDEFSIHLGVRALCVFEAAPCGRQRSWVVGSGVAESSRLGGEPFKRNSWRPAGVSVKVSIKNGTCSVAICSMSEVARIMAYVLHYLLTQHDS